jgi:site-specific DNA-methyltransferase (adenine-specific)
MVSSQIIHGDALDVMREMEPASVDAIVTDPPAGIAFMSKEWDRFRRARNPADAERDSVHGRLSRTSPASGAEGQRGPFLAALAPIFVEGLRVLKPGGYAFVWALPRTSHWTATALEDAGFEIRDSIHHAFGSGFPKAKSNLKPAHEVWWLARRPGPLRHLRIDDCRVGTGKGGAREEETTTQRRYAERDGTNFAPLPGPRGGDAAGRWPANFVLSHALCEPGACAEDCPVGLLDEQSGVRSSGKMRAGTARRNRAGWAGPMPETTSAETYGDTGTASRFFHCFDADPFIYQAKASRKDRGEGNKHPTVKSTALMRHLCRLIAAPGDLVLDMFAGSGSTGVAALAEGMRFIGIEREAEYVEIARRRLAAPPPDQQPLFGESP